MKVALLTVGDELLIGQVVNTNTAWMGEKCTLLGFEVSSSLVLPDKLEAIQQGLHDAMMQNDAVIVTGGLGPTHDDITRDAVAACFDTELALREDIVVALRERFESRGRTFPEKNSVQALVPVGLDVIENPAGTAPGLWFEGDYKGKTVSLAVLPGVPREMKRMMEETVLVRLREMVGNIVIYHRTLLTSGIGESHLQEEVGDPKGLLNERQQLAYLPSAGGVRLRITTTGKDRMKVEQQAENVVEVLYQRLGSLIFGEGEVSLEEVLGKMLIEQNLTLATAESCTGGLVGDRITNISGSSAYYVGGVVAYSNDVKQAQLGVRTESLEAHGAVSEAVALEMAAGVRDRLRSDVGLSITGIMGPSGGSEEKPVGTVWFGYADEKQNVAEKMIMLRDRRHNKLLASTYLINWARLKLLGGQ